MGGRIDFGAKRHAGGILLAFAGIVSLGKAGAAEPIRRSAARQANSAPASEETTAEAKRPLRWYGWQILVADAGTSGLVLLDVALTDGEPAPFLGLFFFASPIVHAVHGNPGRAAASLGLRGALPLAGALLAMQASNCGLLGRSCKEANVAAVIGYASAVILDATLLSWEVDDSTDANRSSLQPALQIGRNGGWLGVAGAL